MDQQTCASCASPNEPPFLFCTDCGTPRVRLGRLRMLGNLTLAMATFMVTYLFAGDILWDWPLFTFFAFFTLQFMLLLVAGRWRLVLRTLAWSFTFYLIFMTVLSILAIHKDGGGFFIHTLNTVPEAAADYPRIFYPVLAGVLLMLLAPFYFRWSRLYGWHNAYRIALLALFALAVAVLLGGRLLELASQRHLFPSQSLFLDAFVTRAKPKYDEWLGLFALISIRILVFEIFVSSALQGYRSAVHARLPDVRARLGGEPAFVRSLVILGQMLRRFLLLLEGMVQSTLTALIELARGLWGVALAFTHDLLLPAVALAAAGTLLYGLTLWTKGYIASNSLGAIFRILGAVAGLLVSVMTFLACVCPFRARRIAGFTLEFGGWLMPNLLVFFLLMSVSLYLTNRVIYGADTENSPLPFKIGLLTKADAAVLVVLVGAILWRRRSLFKVLGAEAPAAPARPAPEEAPQIEAPPAKAKKNKKAVAELKADAETVIEAGGEDKSLLARLTGRARETMRDTARLIGLPVLGRPTSVDQMAKLRLRHEERLAQLQSLDRLRDTISPDAFDKLWNDTRGDLTYLEAELARLQIELDEEYAEGQMEKSTLEARLERLRHEDHESDNDVARAVRTEIESLAKQLESCQRQLEYLAPAAGQHPINTRSIVP